MRWPTDCFLLINERINHFETKTFYFNRSSDHDICISPPVTRRVVMVLNYSPLRISCKIQIADIPEKSNENPSQLFDIRIDNLCQQLGIN